MWHIQREEFKRLKSGSSALNILYQEGCTYVMDNHLAAGWCWYNTLDRRKEYNFCHIDQHDDLANDKHDIVKDLFEETPISLERYISLHYEHINCYDLSRLLEEQISNNKGRLWIVNLDVDYFFNNNVQLFTETYIESICTQIVKEKAKIAVLTIALSPDCCGGWENAIRVYNYIAERLFLEMRL